MIDTANAILSEIKGVMASVPDEAWRGIMQWICEAPRIFVQGTGRSGYIGRAFTMRLMQMGFPAFFVGDTTTPAIGAGDLLITISGSGKTAHLRSNMDLARSLGVRICLITAHAASPMVAMSERSVVIAGPTKMHAAEEGGSRQLIGSLFEQGAFIFCETIVDALAKMRGIRSADLMKRHANLE